MTDKLKEKLGDWLLDIGYSQVPDDGGSSYIFIQRDRRTVYVDNGVADIRIASGDRHYLHSGKYK